MALLGLLCICLIGVAAGYGPVTGLEKPVFIPPEHSGGCKAPVFQDGTYAAELPHGFCGYGTVLHIKCKPGYKLDGPASMKCMYGGHWQPPHIPICKKVDICKYKNPCGYNAKCVEVKGKITCVCNLGYVSTGHKCILKPCPVPHLNNHCDYAPRYKKQWHPGQTIKFTCPPGFILKGDDHAVCLKGGHWSASSPICKKKVVCKVPTLPHYCSYSPRYQVSWEYGKKIEFHCPEGYKMIGKAYAICGNAGKWHSEPPKCDRPKYCNAPKLPEHCSYKPHTQNHWHVGEKIQFHCPDGFMLVGSTYATCIDHGKWDNTPPYCKKPTMCQPPPVKKGCYYKPNFVAWHVSQKVTFYCPDGHKMVGHEYAICQSDGSWDNEPPTCHPPKVCYAPKLPKPVYLTYAHQKVWKIGQKIHFACPAGYTMHGSAYAVCNEEGHWGNSHPTCIKKVVCYLPKLHQYCGYGPHGQQSWYVGSKIKFYCPKGYNLKGSDYALCQKDGSWSHPSPQCDKHDVCYVPYMSKYVSVNDKYHRKYFEVGHKMQFVCPKGFMLKGKEHAVCLPGGKWDTKTPICVRIMCHKPHLTPNCYYQPKYQATWYPGQKVKFYCPYGYEVKGHPYAVCQYDGSWSNPAPHCYKKPVYCKAPTLPPSCHCKMADYSYKQFYKVGESTQFVCPHGFTLKGYAFAKCMYNGYWSHPTPVCIKPKPVKYGFGIGLLHKFW